MAVAVFGQLDHLLRERNLTVADLKRQIEEQYGMDVDVAALDRLAGPEALHHTDLKVIGAVASILEVSLDDLLLVVALPAGLIRPPTEPSFLTEEESRRLTELFDRQDAGLLTADEQRELETLVYDKYGQRSIEYSQRREAKRRGVSLEQVQREDDERIASATKYLKWLDADPRRRQELAERVRGRKASAST